MVPFSVLMSVYHKENPDYFRFSLYPCSSNAIYYAKQDTANLFIK